MICPRSFEVQARRDGRLTGKELASFEQHLEMCRECAKEGSELDVLASKLDASHPLVADELEVRRQRTRLLAAFNQQQLTPDARAWRPWSLVALAGAAICLGFALWFSGSLRDPGVSAVVVRASEGSEWRRHSDGERERVIVERGSLHISVNHVAEEAPLLVVLPDGTLEDMGTIFTVSVADGRTTRVFVEEGSVMLRLEGRAPVLINAGDEWSAGGEAKSAQKTPNERAEPDVEAAPSYEDAARVERRVEQRDVDAEPSE
jgi:hypothetical protein